MKIFKINIGGSKRSQPVEPKDKKIFQLNFCVANEKYLITFYWADTLDAAVDQFITQYGAKGINPHECELASYCVEQNEYNMLRKKIV